MDETLESVHYYLGLTNVKLGKVLEACRIFRESSLSGDVESKAAYHEYCSEVGF